MNIGCVITHESFICAVFAIIVAVNLKVTSKTKEIIRILNYMPLAHMFGCGTIVGVTYLGMHTNILLVM
jgi:long-subunit acyl-CoA synthetase (AMP-forming)